MYWGKKILEWMKTPQEAFAATLYLNNKYELDGRDANSFANIGWIYGLHDRPWGPQRKIFGLIRYMNAAGLERKFDIDGYVKRVAMM
jgi:deoxyribodipyrimidine photo-lyase